MVSVRAAAAVTAAVITTRAAEAAGHGSRSRHLRTTMLPLPFRHRAPRGRAHLLQLAPVWRRHRHLA